ncbi:hypothetical protein PR003_g9901 [Phytophthora rubi]|uniref:Uncharacterized protein n=1 Tax=Phytophthora rubi TaxID=129364 RepID=A0A6A3LS74_9STRA|nr:hypothetical protein PR001_g13202 [Phytophthora rubi]KAE9341583.1 hypothetical protein PR003_g9901 [Phytophthora rubi]
MARLLQYCTGIVNRTRRLLAALAAAVCLPPVESPSHCTVIRKDAMQTPITTEHTVVFN